MPKLPNLPKGYLDMGRAEYSDLDLNTQRAVYAELREILRYTMGKDGADSAIFRQWPTSPEDWIVAAKASQCECVHCKGTGARSCGACIDGRITHSISCARCGGKGWMNFDDMRRGRAYDNHVEVRASLGR